MSKDKLVAEIEHAVDSILGKNHNDPVIEAIKNSTLKPSSPD